MYIFPENEFEARIEEGVAEGCGGSGDKTVRGVA